MTPLLAFLLLFTPPHHAPRAAHHSAYHRRVQRRDPVHRGISDGRAAQIQKALQQAGYLQTVSGRWDDSTIAALKKYQSDHHWQIHYIPDARALLALGLVKPIASDPAAVASEQAQTASDAGGGH
ncbi:MAG: peptidoglycan-binding domain-containing protein [Terriglobales bacterium]